ncbi:site-specific integrase [Mesorhizobium sp. M8A.F.Ca.ET.021.01.1.1]|uniref:tyrosine-type recombinase/integrase n=1 Tax=Mesorhizobium sp. M8A.F.Ca.ET.021.01.1.1 TaxID=2496757 RepID=UPI000FCAAF72|nr:site-specific integrase [Mesorhizobium sp. M8A.F.Ca.ET.021.01.1.1]RUW53749.1 site-specific integrase [Mesorhizobium sp. M8A.F.Ca.ET.021.01.1.1]
MAKVSLTDFKVKSLKKAPAGKRYDVMDSEARGLGVRVNDKGERTFIFYSRFPGKSAPERRVIGEYVEPDENGQHPAMSLAEARKKAGEWRGLIKSGVDPKVKDEEARTAQKISAAQKLDRTFETVLDRYIKARRRDGIRKVNEDEKDFNRECLPKWKGRDVAGLTMTEIMQVVDGIAARGKQRQALNISQKIGTFFNWCVDDEVIGVSPYRAKKVRTAIGQKRRRDRTLNDAELRAFWKATDGTVEDLGEVVSAVYRLLLLSGQRLNDIAEASWLELDAKKQVLTIPAERFKSERDHTVPVTDDAMAIIEKLPRFKKCDWMFSLDGQGSVTVGDKVKKRLDAAMLAELKKHDSEATLPHWINHDIRRTVRTRLSELDVMDEVAEAVIGHVPTELVRTYNQSDRMKVKRDALTRWQGALNVIVGKGNADNVIPMRGASV